MPAIPAISQSHNISFRQLKLVASVVDRGSITKAAEDLFVTQSAATKSLAELETQVGVNLFDRSPLGLTLTPEGKSLLPRIREIHALFSEIDKRVRKPIPGSVLTDSVAFSTQSISRPRLNALCMLHENRNYELAAKRLNLSRAAVYSSIAHIENLLGLELFTRFGKQIVSSDFCDWFVTHMKLVCTLIDQGVDEINSLEGGAHGRLVVGTLPYVRTLIIPLAIQQVLSQHAKIQIATKEGPYESLQTGLLAGDIDLIVGATRADNQLPSLQTHQLLDDELSIVARKNHPLTTHNSLLPSDITKFGMILPPVSTPARKLFEDFLARHNTNLPSQIVETSSLSTIRGLLMHSDLLALLSSHQISIDKSAGLLTTVNLKLDKTKRPIGVTLRTKSTPSRAASIFLEALSEVIREVT